MSVTLTLSQLRAQIGLQLGERSCTGTFTNAPGTTTTAIDASRFDPDGFTDGGFIQNTTVSGGTIARINTWSLTTNTWALYAGFSTSASLGDSYEVHKVLGFGELRQCVNNGLAMIGPALRTMVRDQSQSLVANTYTYTPNYSSGANRFFPGGVVQVAVLTDLGISTEPWLEIPFEYLDDEVIQVNPGDADQWIGNTIRFTGYGPVATFLTSDDPAQVIATLDDDWASLMIMWAATYHAWLLVAAQQSTGENAAAMANAQTALQQFQIARENWRRGLPRTSSVRTPGVIVPMGY